MGLSFLICKVTALMCPSLVPASSAVLGSSLQVPPGVFCRSNPDTFPLVWLGRPLIQPSHPTAGQPEALRDSIFPAWGGLVYQAALR